MTTLVAQLAGYSFGQLIIALIVICAILGVVFCLIRYFQIPVPQVVWQILGIVLVAALGIVAIRFLLSL